MKKLLTLFIAIAMMTSITACSETNAVAENETQETQQIQTEEEPIVVEEKPQPIEDNDKEEQPQEQPVKQEEEPQKPVTEEVQEQPKVEEQQQPQQPQQEQKPVETQPQTKKDGICDVDEDGNYFLTVELPIETDGNEGGLENNWDTVGYRYQDGELEEVMQQVADYCDSLGFEYNDDLTQENSNWDPPAATVSESPNSVVSLLTYYADESFERSGANWYYKVGYSQNEKFGDMEVPGYFVFLFLS